MTLQWWNRHKELSANDVNSVPLPWSHFGTKLSMPTHQNFSWERRTPLARTKPQLSFVGRGFCRFTAPVGYFERELKDG